MAQYDQGQSCVVSFKEQSAKGTPASGASGTIIRVTPSGGLKLAKQIITSNESRRDGQKTRGRHGSRSGAAAYSGELSVGAYDRLFRAGFRGVETATVTRTYDNSAGLTSLQATSTSQLTQVGTTTLLGVVAKGDMVKVGNGTPAANDNIWLRVTNVTATVITVAGTPLTTGAADIACTLTVAKKLLMPTGTPVERYLTLDEYYQDSDISYLGTDFKVCEFGLSVGPDSNAVTNFRLMGLDVDAAATAASPTLTSPVASAGLPLVMADGKIRVNGTDYLDLTEFSLNWNMGGTVPGVLAPNPPDVFLNNGILTGTLKGLRSDASFFSLFDSETQIEFFLHLIEVGDSDPKDFFSIYIGNASLTDCTPSGPGAEGPVVQSFTWGAGVDEAGNPADQTTVKFCSSSAVVS